MRLPTPAELLAVWERGQGQPPVQQALLLLAVAHPESPADDLLNLPIGRRDAALLTLREWLFGPQVEGAARCPACGQQLELSFSTTDIRCGPKTMNELIVVVADRELRFRLPTSADLLAVANGAEPDTAQRALAAQCLLDEAAAPVLALDTLNAIAARMAEADPQAEVQLALTCPDCGHHWMALFDIVGFLWSEINTWAQRMLREVHTLASAYGWREADILALSPLRRQRYLQLVRGL